MQKIIDKMEELKVVPGLHSFVMSNCFVAGGAVRDIKRNTEPKDYDLYFKTHETRDYFIKNYSKYCVESLLGNYDFGTIQFITIIVGGPRTIISGFDWNVNQLYYDFNLDSVSAYYQTDTLRFNTDCTYPMSAFLRLPYLLEKGFKIEPKELMFVSSFISHLGLFNSSSAAEADMQFVPSSGSNRFRITGVPERASEAALRKSPLALAMRELDD